MAWIVRQECLSCLIGGGNARGLGSFLKRMVVMFVRAVLGSLLMLGFGAAVAQAQLPGSSVQLPTYSYFTGNTTVLVPDGGSAFLGGVGRASTGRNEFGSPLLPSRNVGIGSQRGASNVHVTVTIHDFEAMDEYLLGQPSARSNLPGYGGGAAFALSSRPLPASDPRTWRVVPPRSSVSAESLSASVAEERQRRKQKEQARASDAVEYFNRGQKAEAAGKTGAARIFYQMAARRASGSLKEQLTAKLEALGRKQAGSAVVQQDQ